MKFHNPPKAYQQGYVEFYKLKFKVTPDVLIPRPETELLVDEVLTLARSDLARLKSVKSITILDLGTGSGNIAISVAKNLRLHPKSVIIAIVATDISKKALKVAQQNAKLHGVEKNIQFIQSNLLSFINNQYSVRSHRLLNNPLVIVTNLPYIPSQRIPYLDSSVKDFEPHLALDGGEDGFELYRKLFNQINTRLPKRQPTFIIAEIDYTHGELAITQAQKYFPKAKIEVKTDLRLKQRILRISVLSILLATLLV